MKPWTITFEDHTWTDRNVSVGHVVAVAELVDDDWDAVSPWSGPRVLAAWLAVLSAAATDGDVRAAVDRVYRLPVDVFTATLAERNDDPPPPTSAVGASVAPPGPRPAPRAAMVAIDDAAELAEAEAVLGRGRTGPPILLEG